MPKVISYTPAWLSRPSPGFRLFNRGAHTQDTRGRLTNGSSTQNEYVGPNKTIARRNTEVFVAVGRQIRWADLPSLKDQWQALQETPSKKPKGKGIDFTTASSDEDVGFEDGSYRVLQASIGEPIRQLCISPNEDLMAIVTSHTVHIAVLPAPDLLDVKHNKTPLKLKIFTIGPTTHVLSQSPIASVLWHPLGEGGNCLVTTTVDAVVRLWEFDTKNRWSADSPALAVDLKKLVVATSEEDDLLPNRSGRNKIFTPDAAGMDVASTCFGGAGYGDESPWSAMTLWLAMKGGDVYALCPLLPSKWQPPTNLIPSLSTAIIEKGASSEGPGVKDTFEARQAADQFKWIHSLDTQEPAVAESKDEFGYPVEIYKRPGELCPIPQLQGPFQLFSEDLDEDLELSDVHVIASQAAKPDSGSTTSGSASDSISDSNSDDDEEGLSASLVCLMTTEGRVYVCLDLEGVEAQWLARKSSVPLPPPPLEPYLIMLEALDTFRPGESCPTEWPVFSHDVESRYSFYTTHSLGVYYFSLHPWLHQLESELQNDDTAGSNFRLRMLSNSLTTLREKILHWELPSNLETAPSVPACLTLQDSDLGYFVLTADTLSQPQGAILDKPYPVAMPYETLPSSYTPELLSQVSHVAYPPYQPSQIFYADSALPHFLETHLPPRHRALRNEHIRLSTATLDIFTEVHRLLSRETHTIGVAAADLFRRCDHLLEVLQNQILKAGEVAGRVEQVTCENADGWLDAVEGQGRGKGVLEERLVSAKNRQESLAERVEGLRRKVRTVEANGTLSLKEKKWMDEIQGVGRSIRGVKVLQDKEGGSEDGEALDDNVDLGEFDETKADYLRRFRETRKLGGDLLQQAKSLPIQDTKGSSRPSSRSSESAIPPELRRKKVADIKKMLERETLLVQETQAKLEKLTIAAGSA